jgi:hypothetical protein
VLSLAPSLKRTAALKTQCSATQILLEDCAGCPVTGAARNWGVVEQRVNLELFNIVMSKGQSLHQE